jgi:hypothetical protein
VSAADLYAEVERQFSDEADIDLAYLGRLNVEQWSLAMQRVLAFRDAGADDRFHDMDFRAVQRDPIGEVRRLYAWLGEPVTDEFAAGMERWWQRHAENREPNVHPDPATFGLDVDEVAGRFADYTSRLAGWTGADR